MNTLVRIQWTENDRTFDNIQLFMLLYSIISIKGKKMRLDHFVQLPKTHNNKGDIMSKLETPSITSSRGFQPSHKTWVNTMRDDVNHGTFRVYGRIRDTGTNFIVEGWKVVRGLDRTEWVKIPCANLPTAQILLDSVMGKLDFDMERVRQAWDK